MRIEIPVSQVGSGAGRPQARWQPIATGTAAPSESPAVAADADPGPVDEVAPRLAEHDPEDTAHYYERVAPGAAEAGDRARAAPCLLMISPLLPLPRSLPVLIHEALTSEPDFRPDWKWPMLTPRVGPWELVVQMCVGTSLATGQTTGRVYVALDAGFGAYLIVCIDRDPQKLAERQKELLALMAGARLYQVRRPGRAEKDAQAQSLDPDRAGAGAGAGGDGDGDGDGQEHLPPQMPPAELYLKETLFSYLLD